LGAKGVEQGARWKNEEREAKNSKFSFMAFDGKKRSQTRGNKLSKSKNADARLAALTIEQSTEHSSKFCNEGLQEKKRVPRVPLPGKVYEELLEKSQGEILNAVER